MGLFTSEFYPATAGIIQYSGANYVPNSVITSMIKSYLKYLLAFLLLALLIWKANIEELIRVFSQISLISIVLLLLISAALILVSSIKWGLFIKHLAGQVVSIWKLFRLYLLGYFVNLLLPSYLGGDAVRSWKIGKLVGQHNAAAATILERFTGLVAMVLLGLISVFFYPVDVQEVRWAVYLVSFGVFILTVFAMRAEPPSWMIELPYTKKIAPHVQKLHEGFRLSLSRPGLLAQTALLSLLYHCITVANTYVCAAAVGWESVPIGGLFVVLPLILLIGALPVSPNGLGLQEGAFFYFLSGIGATPAQALGVALLLRAKSYVLALIGGIVWISERKRAT